MAENDRYWKEGFLAQVRDGVIPADDPIRPELPAHVTLVEPHTAMSLSLLPPELAEKIRVEQSQLFGGNMLVIAVMPKNDGVEERWPISVEDAMKNVALVSKSRLENLDYPFSSIKTAF